jgi:hypothetical protein
MATYFLDTRLETDRNPSRRGHKLVVASRTSKSLLACMVGLLGPVCAGVGIFEDTAEWCRRFPCRALGQPGNDEAGAYVA